MKSKHPNQVIDIRLQVNHNNAKKFQPIEEHSGATINARLFM